MTRRSEPPRPDEARGAGRVGGRWRLRNWRLRTKLIAMLLIPSVAVLVLVGLRAKADLDRAAGFAAAAERVRVETTVVDVVHQLQRERDLTVRLVAAGRRPPTPELRQQRQRLDAAIGEYERALTASEHGLSDSSAAAFARMGDRLDMLTGLRYAGENTELPPQAVLRSYREMISGLLDIGDQTVSHVADGDLTRSRLAANALARVKEQMSVKRAVVAQALAQGDLPEERERALLAAEAELDAARGDFMTLATPSQQRMYTDTVIGLVVDIGNGIVESVLTRAEAGRGFDGLSAEEWDTSATYTINLIKRVQDAMLVRVQQQSDALATDARRSAAVDAGIVLGALLVAAVLAVVITRSLVRPLRLLRTSALDVAEHRLPAAVEDILTEEHPRPEDTATRAVEPVPVYTREELGEVARAFDAVHGEAVRLAGEQAMLRENVNSMFVNLSRRSQDLVERQLGVLDRMEEHEQDPDILGGLFELDHLATRMRRNSENLLVLAGEESARPLPGSVSADEIVGAALSEVEDYKRIKVAMTPNLSVPGDAAPDLIHVISELFENATAYSPASEPVSVVSSLTGERQWRIDITDRGAGMPETEIRRANKRLECPPDVDVEVSRRMGLYVVGRLAGRHRIEVRLAAADLRGLTATVTVPAELVEFDPSTALGRPRSTEAESDPAPIVPVELGPPRDPSLATGADWAVNADDGSWTEIAAGQGAADAIEVDARHDEPSARHPDTEDRLEVDVLHEDVSHEELVADALGQSRRHGGHAAEVEASGNQASGNETSGNETSDNEASGNDASGAEEFDGLPYEDGEFADGTYQDGLVDGVFREEEDVHAHASIGHAPRVREPHVPVAESAPPAARRSTVEFGGQPVWPAEDDDERAEAAALEEDVPTDRLPAYQAVLSMWFPEAGVIPAVPDEHATERTDRLEAREVVAGELDPADVLASPAGPAGAAESADVAGDSGRAEAARERRGADPPTPVSRDPDAVRERMSSLQRGTRRGRHARTE